MADQSQQLLGVLDALLEQTSSGKDQDSKSLNALLGTVLPSYCGRSLDPEEVKVVLKIFQAFRLLLTRNPSLMIENETYKKLLSEIKVFYDSMKYPKEISRAASATLVQAIATSFPGGKLRNNKYLIAIRDDLLETLERNLSTLLRSVVNSNNSSDTSRDGSKGEVLSLADLAKANDRKLSILSVSVWILQVLLDQSLENVFLLHLKYSMLLDNLVRRLWFCMDNIVINLNLNTDENQKSESLVEIDPSQTTIPLVSSKVDHLYSILLASTISHAYNNEDASLAPLTLALAQCKQLLGWPLLRKFQSLQVTLASSILKLLVRCVRTGCSSYFVNKMRNQLTSFSLRYLETKEIHSDLQTVTCLLVVLCCRVSGSVDTDSGHFEKLLQRAVKPFVIARLESLREFSLRSLHIGTDELMIDYALKLTDGTSFIFLLGKYSHLNLLKDVKASGDTVTKQNTKISLARWIHLLNVKLTKDPKAILSSNIGKLYLANALGTFICILHGDYDFSYNCCSNCDSYMHQEFYIDARIQKDRQAIALEPSASLVYGILLKFFIDGTNTVDPIISVTVLNSLIKLFGTFAAPVLSKEASLWAYIQKCFVSEVREIRLLSVKLLPILLYDAPEDVYNENFDAIMGLLNSFKPTRQNQYLFEGIIMAWGELLIISKLDSRFYVLLNPLIQFMGDTDEFRSNLALHEVRIVASTKRMTPWKLVEPFIPLISCDLIKKRTTNPGLLSTFCQCIRMDTVAFLSRTQEFTVPRFIQYFDDDHIGFLARSLRKTRTQLVLSNIDKVLAILLISEPEVSPKKIMNILGIYVQKYKGLDLRSTICNVNILNLIWELLCLYNCTDDVLKRLRSAILYICIERHGKPTADISKEQEAQFFDSEMSFMVLGIAQHFSDIIHNNRGSKPFLEKVQAIRAVRCLAEISQSFETCLSQIMTCLQIALESPELQYECLECLSVLISHLGYSELSIILDLIISYLIQKYPSFNKQCREISKKILSDIFGKDPLFNKEHPSYVYSLASAHVDLSDIINKDSHIAKNLNVGGILKEFTIRLQSENKWVLLQVLEDLMKFLKVRQMDLQKSDITDSRFSGRFSLLIANILRASNRFSGKSMEIAKQCSSVLGIIGALDFSKFGSFFQKRRKNPILATNLTKRKEVFVFSAYLFNNYLVKCFVASTDPQKQLFLAYAMQQILKYLKIDYEKINEAASTEQIFWLWLNNLSQTVLRPLLNSKYQKSAGKWKELDYPTYNKKKQHSKWLIDLTEDLLHEASHNRKMPEAARKIFGICIDVVRGQDLSISEFLLPYVSLLLVVYGDNKVYANIETEIDVVLNVDPDEMVSDSSVESLKSCYRTVFSVIDYFREWVAEQKKKKRHPQTGRMYEESKKVEQFLANIPPELLAKRTAQCNSYERAIFNLEQSYQMDKLSKKDFFGTIRHMYSAIDDLDALQGVLKKFSTDTLDDKLLQFQYSEDWKITHESLAAIADSDYDKSAINHSARITSLLKALDDHCEYGKVLLELRKYEDLMMNSDTIDSKELFLCGLQSSIFTGKLDELSKWVGYSERTTSILSAGSDLSISYEFAQALLSLHANNIPDCQSHISKASSNLGIALSVSKGISHTKISNYMVLLHCLYDFSIIASIKPGQALESSKKLLEYRERNAVKDFRTQWKIHSIKRTIEMLHPVPEVQKQLGDTLVKSSQILREAGRLDLATKSITHALTMGMNNPTVNFEFAQLLWAQGEHRQALQILNTVLDQNKNPKMQLKYTHWLESSGNGSSDEIVNGYKSAAAAKSLEECGRAHYYLGRYYNKLLDAQAIETPGLKKLEKDFYGDLEYKVIKAYMRSASFSDEYLFEVLPKAVTIWLDYMSKYRDTKLLRSYSTEIIMAKRKDNYSSILKFINACVKGEIDTYKWYTVLSQLISRMVHGDHKTENLILNIILELAKKYPEVILYSVYSQVQSNSPERTRRGKQLFNALENGGNKELSVHVHEAYELLEGFKGLCQAKPSRALRGKLNLWDDLHFSFKRDTECHSLALPIRRNFDQLHSPVTSVEQGSVVHHRQMKFVTFFKFEKNVTIVDSMQKPRRIYVIGTDLKMYSILCKPNDDLRKDGKLMEFATVMDRLLQNDFESEKRNLSITSYAVVPLNESMGLIEMVDNVRTIRDIMLAYLQLQGRRFDFGKVKSLLGDPFMALEDKLRNFKKLKEMYQPVLQIWFADRFPNPVNWYEARNRYTRSCAVMSIVGYLLGMGDRHGDNILLNELTGQILHVDFDCLFDKGKKLRVPERVPFRLTQNMTAAMGVNGYEGTFRRTCEVTMRLIRQNENTLMNILETFLYDPILDWKKSSKKRKPGEHNAGAGNAKLQPQVAMNTIRRKIKGILDPRDLDTGAKDSGGLSVSVNAQVEAVIQQATSEENLAQMYVGWMPFL